MKLVENDKVLQDDMVARELHERFKSLVSTLNEWKYFSHQSNFG